MSAKLKIAGIFALGFVTGVVVMIVLILKGPARVMQNMWAAMISEHARHAQLIHEGQAAKVEEMLEETFIPSAWGMERMRFPKDLRVKTLWDIRTYYEATGRPAPMPLSNIFQQLPPRAAGRANRPAAGGK